MTNKLVIKNTGPLVEITIKKGEKTKISWGVVRSY